MVTFIKKNKVAKVILMEKRFILLLINFGQELSLC